MKTTLIGATQMLDLLEALRRLGADPELLCRHAALDPRGLHESHTRVSAEAAIAVFAGAERMLGDPRIGLHAGEGAEPRSAIDYLIMSGPRLRDGIAYACRFAPLMMDTLRLGLDVDHELARFTFELGDAAIAGNAHVVEYVLMVGLRALQRAVGTDLGLRVVHVRSPGKRDDAEATRAFGCPVHFGAPETALVFTASALDLPSRFANALVAVQLEKFAASLSSQVSQAATLRERVVDAVRAALLSGVRPNAAAIARQLGLGQRTLRRGLEGEGRSFRELRDAVLWEVVDALLSNRSLKVEAIALSVGFTEVAAFSKAFKRWARCTPTEYRSRRQGAEGLQTESAPATQIVRG